MTSITRFFIISKKTGFFFVILVPFEILSQYPNIDCSHWLGKEFQWIIDKVFREKIMVQMASKFSSRISGKFFWFLSVIVVVFIITGLIVMSC